MQLTGSPNIVLVRFEHKSSRFRIFVDSISNANFEKPITKLVSIIQTNLVSGDCNDDMDEAD